MAVQPGLYEGKPLPPFSRSLGYLTRTLRHCSNGWPASPVIIRGATARPAPRTATPTEIARCGVHAGQEDGVTPRSGVWNEPHRRVSGFLLWEPETYATLRYS